MTEESPKLDNDKQPKRKPSPRAAKPKVTTDKPNTPTEQPKAARPPKATTEPKADGQPKAARRQRPTTAGMGKPPAANRSSNRPTRRPQSTDGPRPPVKARTITTSTGRWRGQNHRRPMQNGKPPERTAAPRQLAHDAGRRANSPPGKPGDGDFATEEPGAGVLLDRELTETDPDDVAVPAALIANMGFGGRRAADRAQPSGVSRGLN